MLKYRLTKFIFAMAFSIIPSIARFIAAFLLLVCTHAEAWANESILLQQGVLPLMGNCAMSGLTTDPRATSDAVSTISCHGIASTPMALTFSGGEVDRCIYIDNLDPSRQAYFVPTRTLSEWLSFKQATLPSGKLSGAIQVTYGCDPQTVSDACDMRQLLPRARNGETSTVSSLATKVFTYECVANDQCGTWVLRREEGTCPINGRCGASDGQSSSSAPTANLCASGEPTPVHAGSTWSWRCNGTGGGTGMDCTAPIMQNGTCGASADIATATPPSSDLCARGWASAVIAHGAAYTWSCSGVNGGDEAFCSAPKATDCALPWGGTIASGQSVTAYAVNSVACGSTCTSETRVCSNGTLSGSFTYATCAVSSCGGHWVNTCWGYFGACGSTTTCGFTGYTTDSGVYPCPTLGATCTHYQSQGRTSWSTGFTCQ